jgi:hypothetical protein
VTSAVAEKNKFSSVVVQNFWARNPNCRIQTEIEEGWQYNTIKGILDEGKEYKIKCLLGCNK